MSAPSFDRRSMIVDTDGGTDDAVALWWALTDPRVDLVAITVTWGNVDLATATATVRRVLAAAGRTDVPVAVGAAGPVGPTPLAGLATHVHGNDGLGGHAGRWPVGGAPPGRSTNRRPSCCAGSPPSGPASSTSSPSVRCRRWPRPWRPTRGSSRVHARSP